MDHSRCASPPSPRRPMQAPGPRPRRRARRWALALGALVATGAALALGPSPSPAQNLVTFSAPAETPRAEAAMFKASPGGGVRFEMRLSVPVEHQLLLLTGHDRIVVDFPAMDWRLHEGPAPNLAEAPGVDGLRFAQFTKDRARLVLDLSGPPEIKAYGAAVHPGGGALFTIDFRVPSAAPAEPERPPEPVGEPQPARSSLVAPLRPSAGFAPLLAAAAPPRPRPHREERNAERRVVVVIDPGHGGADPGAVHGGIREKDFTLDMARRLKVRLEQEPGYVVHMTRNRDRAVSLPARAAFADEVAADIFLSLHADALENDVRTSGATIYTLSETASDRLSAALAERENAADARAGFTFNVDNDTVRKILYDVAQKRMQEESVRAAHLLVDELGRRVNIIAGNPHRQAGFRVLKQFDRPAILIELGFLTSVRDRRRFEHEGWREAATDAIAVAVERWSSGDVTAVRSARLTR